MVCEAASMKYCFESQCPNRYLLRDCCVQKRCGRSAANDVWDVCTIGP